MNNMSGEKIRVLQFASSANIGGTERMLVELVTRMNAARFTNEICFLFGPGPIGEELARRGFRVYYLDFKGYNLPWVVIRLIGILRRNKFDLVHVYGLKANILARILCRIWGPERLITGQRSTDRNRHFVHTWLDRLTSKYVSLYISNSEAAKKVLIEREKIPENKIMVVPNGVDCSLFRPPSLEEKQKAQSRLGLQPDKVVIVSVANLLPVKGHHHLLEAVAATPSTIRERIYLLLAGEGPLRPALEKQAEALKLSGIVRFLGRQDRRGVAETLRAADIFVLASLWEGLPNAILEAMACGLPVIATDVGGIPELIQNNKNGLLVQPQDTATLTQSILKMLQDIESRRLIGDKGRERALSNFSLEAMITKTEEIYEVSLP